MKILNLTFAALIVLCTASAQNKFDYSDIKNGLFAQRSVSGLRSSTDGESYTVRRGNNIIRYSYKSGAPIDSIGIPNAITITDYQFSADGRRILLTTDQIPVYRHSFLSDYYICDVDQNGAVGQPRPLSTSGRQRAASLSPDGSRVLFVRDNNLLCVDLDGGREWAITTDGEPRNIINGIPDWVYEEEFGFDRAYEWSPDSKRVTFLRFDESRVPEFTLMKSVGSDYDRYKYPYAGEVNSTVELHVYDFGSGLTTKVDTGKDECYIPRIGWTPLSEIYFYRLNRRQNHFETLVAEPDQKSAGMIPSRRIYEEKADTYIEQPDDRTVSFMPDGQRFIVKSEREGRMHLYLYDRKRGLQCKITDGNWDVTQLLDIVGERIYYVSTEGSELRNNLYCIKTDGRGKKRLTDGRGIYSIAPSSGFRYFVSTFSNAANPATVSLHDSEGRLIRTLENNTKLKATIARMNVPLKKFFKMPISDSLTLNGYMIRPEGFDSTRRYPVLMTQYSGPGSQQVVDRWSVDWCDVMVQHGYIVMCVDPRGTGMRGTDFKKCTYGKLGVIETEDQLAATRYIGALPYVDASRIGIYGWSYGGFMALNSAFAGGELFKMAIAVAPVTSWRYYDTIYTERYNGLPQDNAEGYDARVPLSMADGLKCRLLIVHGTADDNVHIVNTYRVVERLVEADKQFDMMIYPDSNHGMRPAARTHVMDKLVDYALRNL